MSTLLLNFLSIEMQYICSAALILICVLTCAHLYVMHKRKTGELHAANTDPPEQDDPAEEVSLEEFSEEPAEEIEDGEAQIVAESESQNLVDFERHEQVSVAEVGDLISDEVAVSYMEEAEETVFAKPKGIINIDTLSKNYQANETVTLESLKEKKLIGNSVNYVKVLARGVLNKPLIVKMPEFSVDAVKMILLTGGKAIKLKSKRE